MLVNINAVSAKRQNALGELGELSRSRIFLSEFKYNRGAEIYGETETADYIYQVLEGAVRSYKLLSDGRRQIGAFHLVGDIFGLENGATHRFTTEAIVDTTVRLMKRRSLEHVAETDVFVALDLLNMTTTNRLSPGCRRNHSRTSKPSRRGIFKSNSRIAGSGYSTRLPNDFAPLRYSIATSPLSSASA